MTEEITPVADEPQPNALEMSDEDIMNMAPPPDEPYVPNDGDDEDEGRVIDETTPPAVTDDGEEKPDGQEEVQTGEQETPPNEQVDSTKNNVYDDTGAGATGEEPPPDQGKPKAEKKAKKDDQPGDVVAPLEIDYEAEYKRLIAPFKANGRQMQVAGVDDALTLMQMGANYNKKMAGLKPNLKLMKMLENNELLDEEKLTYLIDLSKKDPGAISKLLTDSGIDPLNLEGEDKPNYEPKTYTVDDNEVDLDQALADIQDTDTFQETINIVSTKWDNSSRQEIQKDPKLIKIINEHVGNGIYAHINTVMENERALGRLEGLSDLEAYQQIGDAIQSYGGFNQVNQLAGTPPVDLDPAVDTAPVTPVTDTPAVAPTLNDKRRAAGSPRTTPPAGKPQEFDPLALSDEDFEKLTAGQLM